MANRKWTDDEVKAEIAAAVKIVNEDRERAAYNSLHAKYGGGKPSGNDDDSDPKGPPAPPAKDSPDGDGEKPKRKSLWWGDTLDDSE